MATSRRAVLFGLVGGLCACSRPVTRPDGGKGLLPVGAPAPRMTAFASDGKSTQMEELRGQAVVVYFYPRDDTPGCTKEACAFRDVWAQYSEAHVAVIGVSKNSRESHREFQRNHRLPFPLVADEDGSVALAYGVPSGMLGHARVSFLVGPTGTVARVFPDVDPGTHAADVLNAAAALR